MILKFHDLKGRSTSKKMTVNVYILSRMRSHLLTKLTRQIIQPTKNDP